ncbi:hydroxymethylpyrimidine/phosphomethylpyrimidine kinase [Marinobacter sp. R17]|uniref:bifunctional hydroxymethylpyrimidine kinase/phosphomethylpyrimidine kinase n=1 Tax=Marinobacter sp. R17 TaxID=2484250 RepID=UPI000F4CCEF4|nr:hydroxymethylpyrimidine/phosphomethylpyrimidine kinase [Marinobacter sp. R17]ROT95985.1 hydroxymethylpyrimidine/phosphomethylpyrimidine kinase [Marinobacter sp. R17]
MHQRPHVLILSGLDPSGGAGIQADIQAVTALGCHPLPVISCLTVQDTCNVHGAEAIDPALVRQQLECLAKDVPIHAVKTGALGSAAIVDVLVDFMRDRTGIPLVVDPVIKAAGGGDLADDELIQAMTARLFQLADVITPNGIELAQLGEDDDTEAAARRLLEAGCPAVLATGGHGTGPQIINRLFRAGTDTKEWHIDRLGGEYHGSGCTLAAGIAAGRAKGLSLEDAIERSQYLVARAIDQALTVGKGQPVPDRSVAMVSS